MSAPLAGRIAAETRIHLPYAGRNVVRPPSPVTQLGGSVNDVATDGRYAFAGIGPRLVVLDLEPAGAPVLVWQSPPLAGPVREVVLTQQRVWLTIGHVDQLQAYDVHDPRAPRQVFDGPAPGASPRLIGASGNMLFARSGWDDVLVLIDVSAASRPTVLSEIKLPSGGVGAQAVAKGPYLFVARHVDEDWPWVAPGIAVVDIRHPASPREAAFLRLPVEGGSFSESPHAIDVAGDRLVAVSNSTTWWIDIARPSAPFVVGTRPGGVHDVEMVGDTTWLLEGANRATSNLVAVDASSPSRLRTLVSQSVPTAFGLAHGGDRVVAYTAGFDAMLTVVDVAKPSAPRVHGQFKTLGTVARTMPLGDRLVIAGYDSITVVPLAATGGLSSGPSGGAVAGAVSHRSAWIDGPLVAARRDEVWTLDREQTAADFRWIGWDVADPARPTARWHAIDPHYPTGFAAVDDVRFFGAQLGWSAGRDWSAGLVMLDVADPGAAARFGPLSETIDGGRMVLAVDGDRLYAASSKALWAVDVTDPRAWREIARARVEPPGYRPGYTVFDVAVQGHTVLVTTPAGVAAFDTADGGLRAVGGLMLPPTEVVPGRPGAHQDAVSAPGRLYVHTPGPRYESSRVSAYDVTRPLDPVLLRTWEHPGELQFEPCGLGADERTVAIAACSAGVLLVDAP